MPGIPPGWLTVVGSERLMLKSILIFLVLGLTFIVGCQVTQPPTVSATPTAAVMVANTIPAVSTEEPTLESVKTAVATTTSTTTPQPTQTAMPTPLPTDTPTPIPVPVWSILFTGSPCSATTSDCSPSPDSPPTDNYFIYSDGTEMQLLSEMGIPYNMEDTATMGDTVETIQLSSDRKRLAYMEDDNQGISDFGLVMLAEIVLLKFQVILKGFGLTAFMAMIRTVWLVLMNRKRKV
ncbi:MAG: hypothetical protein M5U34_00225 [Chloroflexi bacterium]|nr:hypothetical protein [Chloroflexota bacterium]